MNIQEDLNRELARIQRETAAGDSAGRLSLNMAGGELRCELESVDRIGCQLNSIQFHTTRLANAGPERLERLGRQLSQRLNYLMEPIQLIELDPRQCVVQLRSNPPLKDELGTHYYELLVRAGGEVSLRRFRKSSGQVRQQVPADMTRQALLRVASDLTCVDP